MKKFFGAVLILFILQTSQIVMAFPTVNQIVQQMDWVRAQIKEIKFSKNKSKKIQNSIKFIKSIEDISLKNYLFGYFYSEFSCKNKQEYSLSFLRKALKNKPKPQKFLETLILEKIISLCNQEELNRLKFKYPNNLIFNLNAAIHARKNIGDAEAASQFEALILECNDNKKSDLYIKVKAYHGLACIYWTKNSYLAENYLLEMNEILYKIQIDTYTRGKMYYFIGSFMKEYKESLLLMSYGYLKLAQELLLPYETKPKYLLKSEVKINAILASDEYHLESIKNPDHWALEIH
jgi:flavodoxin